MVPVAGGVRTSAARSWRGGRARTGRLLWSTSARRGMDAVLADFRPDVVHLHNIYHQLSPSILRAGPPTRRRRASMTLHDYKLACPTYRFMDHGEICERVPRPIASGSRSSGAAATAARLARERADRGRDDAAHVRTRVRARRHLRLPESVPGRTRCDRARCSPTGCGGSANFVDLDAFTPKQEPGGDVVFAGRLSAGEGRRRPGRGGGARAPDLRLDVAGDGPSRASLEAQANERGASERIRFHGRLPSDTLQELLRSASVAAVPSRWYENSRWRSWRRSRPGSRSSARRSGACPS